MSDNRYTPWTIAAWSRELGRGQVRSGDRLYDFDANYALVEDFRIGEAVHVELERRGDSYRVVRLWPDDPRISPSGESAAAASRRGHRDRDSE